MCRPAGTEATSLNANPHIFLSVCSFLLVDMGLIGNDANEQTDCTMLMHEYRVYLYS